MNGSTPADATETAHRRRDSRTADAVDAARDAAESGGTAGGTRVNSTAPPVVLPLPVRLGVQQRNRTLPPPRSAAHIGEMRATPRRGGHAGEQTGASRHEQTRENRRSQVKLSEAGGQGAAGLGRTTLERLTVKGLTRYYHGIDDEARRALAAAEPQLTGTVWDAVIAATVEHANTTHSRGAGVDPGPPSAS